MEQSTFEYDRREVKEEWMAGVVFSLFVLICVMALFYRGFVLVGTSFLLIGLAYVLRYLFKVRQVARQITLADEHIDAWDFGGRHITLKWDELAELRQIALIMNTATITVFRLISRDRRQQIIFTDRIPGFNDLMTVIRQNAPHVRMGGMLTFGEQLIRWGF